MRNGIGRGLSRQCMTIGMFTSDVVGAIRRYLGGTRGIVGERLSGRCRLGAILE